MFLLIPIEPSFGYWCFVTVWLGSLLYAFIAAPWRELAALNQRQHAWFAAILALAFFWLLQVNVRDVLAFHPLAVTTLTLVFGWHLAVSAASLALLLNAVLLGRFGFQLPLEMLINVVLPASATVAFLKLLERWTPRNVFIFMLGGGFAGGMLSLLAVLCGSALVFQLSNAQAHWLMLSDYAHLFVLMLFPEGFINGAMTSVLTIFYPQLVRSFDDDAYLDSQL